MSDVPSSSRHIILVTGMSGAGMSTALKALEDIGYEAVDNLPLSLVEALVENAGMSGRPLAIGIDSRTRDFTADAFIACFGALTKRSDLNVHLLFMESDDDVLQRRFTTTRRRHPMAGERPLQDGIARERALLFPIATISHITLDTSLLSPHRLRHILQGHFQLQEKPSLHISVLSFSYRSGIPREADLVFDVRFLTNPHWEPALKDQTGQDKPVQKYIAQDESFAEFVANLEKLLLPLLPRYQEEGKSYLTLAFGCTGGQHRSVFLAETFSKFLSDKNYNVTLIHRELANKNKGG